MATEIHFRDGSQFRKAKEVHFRDGSAWRKANEIHVHDGTAWRKVYQGFQVVINGVTYDVYAEGVVDTEFPEVSDLQTICRVVCETDGSGSVQGWVQNYTSQWNLAAFTAKNWGSPTQSGIGANYHARLRVQTGKSLSYGMSNAWYALTSQVFWQWAAFPADYAGATFYVDISADGGSTTLATSQLSTASFGWNYI